MWKIATSVGALTASLGGYAAARTHFNRQEQHRLDTDDAGQDTTRPQYLRFGMNWGAGTDLMILEESDTGDVLLGTVNCDKELDVNSLVRCHVDHSLSIHRYDWMGVLIRTPREVKVVYWKFGKVWAEEYPALVSKIWNQYLVLRRVSIAGLPPKDQETFATSAQTKLLQFLDKIEEADGPVSMSKEDFLKQFGLASGYFASDQIPASLDALELNPPMTKGVSLRYPIVVRIR
jgi:hypothetical protein